MKNMGELAAWNAGTMANNRARAMAARPEQHRVAIAKADPPYCYYKLLCVYYRAVMKCSAASGRPSLVGVQEQ
jgi:hypothetical protein